MNKKDLRNYDCCRVRRYNVYEITYCELVRVNGMISVAGCLLGSPPPPPRVPGDIDSLSMKLDRRGMKQAAAVLTAKGRIVAATLITLVHAGCSRYFTVGRKMPPREKNRSHLILCVAVRIDTFLSPVNQ